jgi:hypothetical protein
MKRRQFVSGVSSSLTIALLGGGCGGESVAIEMPSLVRALGESEVRQLGRAYLAQTPAERTREALRQSVGRAVQHSRAHWWSPTPSLDQLVARDFESAQTCFVDGWMLSVNEARQCALAALAAT